MESKSRTDIQKKIIQIILDENKDCMVNVKSIEPVIHKIDNSIKNKKDVSRIAQYITHCALSKDKRVFALSSIEQQICKRTIQSLKEPAFAKKKILEIHQIIYNEFIEQQKQHEINNTQYKKDRSVLKQITKLKDSLAIVDKKDKSAWNSTKSTSENEVSVKAKSENNEDKTNKKEKISYGNKIIGSQMWP